MTNGELGFVPSSVRAVSRSGSARLKSEEQGVHPGMGDYGQNRQGEEQSPDREQFRDVHKACC